MMGFPLRLYFAMAIKVFMVTTFMIFGVKYVLYGRVTGVVSFFFYSCIIVIVLTVLYSIIIGRSDRSYIFGILKKKVTI